MMTSKKGAIAKPAELKFAPYSLAHPLDNTMDNIIARLADEYIQRSRAKKAAQEKAAKEKAAREKTAQEKAALEKVTQEKATKEKAAREKANREKILREKAAKEKFALEKAAQEKAAQEKAAKEKAAQEKAAQEKAAKEKAAQEKAVKERAAREKTAQEKIIPKAISTTKFVPLSSLTKETMQLSKRPEFGKILLSKSSSKKLIKGVSTENMANNNKIYKPPPPPIVRQKILKLNEIKPSQNYNSAKIVAKSKSSAALFKYKEDNVKEKKYKKQEETLVDDDASFELTEADTITQLLEESLDEELNKSQNFSEDEIDDDEVVNEEDEEEVGEDNSEENEEDEEEDEEDEGDEDEEEEEEEEDEDEVEEDESYVEPRKLLKKEVKIYQKSDQIRYEEKKRPSINNYNKARSNARPLRTIDEDICDCEDCQAIRREKEREQRLEVLRRNRAQPPPQTKTRQIFYEYVEEDVECNCIECRRHRMRDQQKQDPYLVKKSKSYAAVPKSYQPSPEINRKIHQNFNNNQVQKSSNNNYNINNQNKKHCDCDYCAVQGYKKAGVIIKQWNTPN